MRATTRTKKKVISGWAFHCHHDLLYEFVTNYNERVAYIKRNKPQEEQKLRLRLFRMIPEDRLPYDLIGAGKAYDEAGKAYDEAGKARDEAWKAYNEAGKAYDEAGKAYDEAGKAHNEAGEAHNEAGEAYDEARKAFDKAGKARDEAWKAHNEARKAHNEAGEAYDEAGEAYDSYFKELHSELCPHCPWDGKTIFSKGG